MALNRFFNQILKVSKHSKNTLETNKLIYWKYFTYFCSILIIFSILGLTLHFNNEKKKLESQNLGEVVNSKEFSNLSNYFISKINSPYREVKYIIQNNDSIEKILKDLSINKEDIKNISNSLKQKKLTNIYAGRQLSLVMKKLNDGSNSVINIVYPVNNTLSIEIRKSQNNFIVKENVLKLYKKEVVVKNEIKNNL